MRKCDRPIQSIVSTITFNKVKTLFRIGGEHLSKHNVCLVRDALRCYTFVQQDIARRHNLSLTIFWQNLYDLPNIDIVSMISYFEAIRDFLIRLPKNDVSYRFLRSELAKLALSHNIDSWKTLIRHVVPLLKKVPAYSTRLEVMKDISILLLFFKKMPFKDIGIEDVMLEKYLTAEAEQCDLVYDEETCNALADIINEWFNDFDYSEFRPFHGSGSTAMGKLSLYEKYCNLHTDSLLLRFINLDEKLALEYFPMIVNTRDLMRVSRLMFVPKTATKLRVISMEPPSLMYIQEGIRIELQKYIAHHPFLSKVIQFDNQEQNQMYAHIGSILQNIATIDLSAASDSVTLELIRKIMRKTPKLYKCCIMTRSTHTLLPNDQVIKLNKFAPMGSAMSFPIECVVFAAIVELCYRRYQGIEKRLDKRYFSIYGDDIICNDFLVEDVMNLLTDLHFKVNRDKSFFHDVPFRESCGMDYYNGVDVKTVYYRVPVSQASNAPKRFQALIGLQHSLINARCPSAAQYVVRLLLKNYQPLFSNDFTDTSALYSSTATNYHLTEPDIGYIQDYQDNYFLYDCVTTKSKTLPSVEDVEQYDYVRYFDWLVSHSYTREVTWKDYVFPVEDNTNLLGGVPILGRNSTVRGA